MCGQIWSNFYLFFFFLIPQHWRFGIFDSNLASLHDFQFDFEAATRHVGIHFFFLYTQIYIFFLYTQIYTFFSNILKRLSVNRLSFSSTEDINAGKQGRENRKHLYREGFFFHHLCLPIKKQI